MALVYLIVNDIFAIILLFCVLSIVSSSCCSLSYSLIFFFFLLVNYVENSTTRTILQFGKPIAKAINQCLKRTNHANNRNI